jgi:hypothetical protein
MGWLKALFSPLATLGSTYLTGKNQEAMAKTAAKVITLQAEADVKVAGVTAANKLAETGQTQDYNLDYIAMTQMDKSLLDDFMILLLLLPVVLAFVGYADEVNAGFSAFEAMPDWFQYLIIAAYVVKLGLRGLLAKILTGKLSLSKTK